MSHNPYRHDLDGHALSPETLMMSYGYDPALSEGSIKPPIFLTSTFVFRSAEEGKDFFNIVSGRKAAPAEQKNGLVYSRFNQPNSEIVEDRLALYEHGEDAALFSSGMAAITTSVLAFVQPGDVILQSQPLYGGTETLFLGLFKRLGIDSVHFDDGCDAASVRAAIERVPTGRRIAAIYVETPSNPTNTVVDLALLAGIARELGAQQGHQPLLICDNTLLGPVFQRPLEHGADLSVYSLTKYVGGHSDVVAGAAIGSKALLKKIKSQRSAIGTQLDPHSCWMLGRSLETLALRMDKANRNAALLARFLQQHPHIRRVHYLDFLPADSAEYAAHHRQSSGAGSTFAIEVGDDEAAAFRFLNHLAIFKLAVSLGGTESLASHPASTTHSGIDAAVRQRMGITDNLVRLSIGIENAADLQRALSIALDAV